MRVFEIKPLRVFEIKPCGLKETLIFERKSDNSIYYHCKVRNHRVEQAMADIRADVPNYYISR